MPASPLATSLAPATARIRANQAGHWSCARRRRGPARSQSRRRSRRSGACEALQPSQNAILSVVSKQRSPKKQWNSTFNTNRKKTRQRKRPEDRFPERSALGVTTKKRLFSESSPGPELFLASWPPCGTPHMGRQSHKHPTATFGGSG